MFRSLLWFEIKNRLGRASTLIYFALFFVLSVLMASAFGSGIISLGLSNKLVLNSPVVLHQIICSAGFFALLVAAPIFGQGINQDFETGFYQVLFATPLRKSTYFFVRYLGSFLSLLTIFISIGLGVYLATFMPFINQTLVGENHLWFYVAPYFSLLIPNILIFGAIFIAVAALSKKMLPVYIANVVIFIGMMISQKITGDLDNKLIAALADPFGLESIKQVTRYWSVLEQSTQIVPVVGTFLYNRLLWGGVGILILAFAYISFNPFRFSKEKKKGAKIASTENGFRWKKSNALEITLTPSSWKVFWQLTLSEFKQVFSNIYFLILLLFGLLYIFVCSGQVSKIFGTETIPVTYMVLEIIGGTFSLFVAIITIYYAGELVWKDKEKRVYELIDSKPVSTLFLYFSKLLSLAFMQIFLLGIILISSILIQIFKGYFHFELNVYLQYLFLYTLPSWLLTCVMVLFIQTLSRNKYVGHSISILYCLFLIGLPLAGFDHWLYLIGFLPKESYSAMNAFGTALWPFSVVGLYWGFFHIALAVLTILFWQRGVVLTRKDRFALYKSRKKPVHKILFVGSLSAWMLMGGFIYYNTNILNTYKTETAKEKESVDYEKGYKYFETMAQPDLVAVNVQVDIFPESQSMKGKGRFNYRNSSGQPIQTLLLNVSEKSKIAQLSWSRPANLTKFDERLGLRIYDFVEPIQPGEELQLEFSLSVCPKGFANGGFSKKIVENGTFFYGEDFFPFIGYVSRAELASEKSRKKYGLPEKARMPSIHDQEAIQNTYLSSGGTWIDFEATVSTSKDQIAITPGYLERQWEEGGRRYFHYKMDQPILKFYAFLSGRYEVVTDQWNGVKIEVYHHPGHTRNISTMISSVKKSLDYYSKNFSPYQFKQFRIIEFPRYSLFAQAFPNTIPYSEGIGFIAKVDPNNPEDVDYPFYVTAHEVAHQWWAHQVIGGNVQGATMLSESLAQYSALMVMEKEFGPQQMKKFLKYELDKYLHGRSREEKKELPLMLNENQQYIHYEKGSLVFYALKDYLGEEVVNKVLHDYIEDVAFQSPPFTRTTDLVTRFREAAPEDKKYLIEDLFETITFYDNRTDSVIFHKTPNGKYAVEIHAMNKKLRVDELGKEEEIPMDDYVDVGIFDKEGNLTYLQKHKIKSGLNKILIEVDREPGKAGVDPLNKLIDKISDDNVMKAMESIHKEDHEQ